MKKEWNLSYFFQKILSTHKGEDLVGWPEGEHIKYFGPEEYIKTIKILSLGLLSYELTHGVRCAIFGDETKELSFLEMALNCTKNIIIPIPINIRRLTLKTIFDISQVNVVIVEDNKAFQKIHSTIFTYSKVQTIIFLNNNHEKISVPANCKIITYLELFHAGLNKIKSNGDIDFENLLKENTEDNEIIYNFSPYSREPKGYIGLNKHILKSVTSLYKAIHNTVDRCDRCVIYTPSHHDLGRLSTYFPLLFDGKTLFMDKDIPPIEQFQKISPTILIIPSYSLKFLYREIHEYLINLFPYASHILEWAINSGHKYYNKIDSNKIPSTLEQLKVETAFKLIFKHIQSFFGDNLKFVITDQGHLTENIYDFFRFSNISILETYCRPEVFGPCTLSPIWNPIPYLSGISLEDNKINIGDDQKIIVSSPSLATHYLSARSDGKQPRPSPLITDQKGIMKDDQLEVIGTIKNEFLHKKELVHSEKLIRYFTDNTHIRYFYPLIKNNLLIGIIGISKSDFKPLINRLGKARNMTYKNFVALPEVKNIIGQDIKRVNQKLKQHEQIDDFIIYPNYFTIENGLLNYNYQIEEEKLLKDISLE